MFMILFVKVILLNNSSDVTLNVKDYRMLTIISESSSTLNSFKSETQKGVSARSLFSSLYRYYNWP